ncbi:MAG: tetratricopeptide repeat protein, partial [Anaerolineales bacterium]
MITHTLKQYLDKRDFPVVIRALRQNETIWQTLQQGTLLEQLLNRPNDSGLLRWTPASIALTELGLTHLIARSDEHVEPLDDDTLNTAAEALEALLSKRQNPTHLEDLRQAGLAALAIRERWMILNEVEDSFFNFIHQCTPIWELTISILLGLVPNKTAFVEYFSHSSKESDNRFAIHALLSQPIPIEKIAQVLTPILADQDVLKRSASLRMVNQKSPALAQQIATQLLETVESIQDVASDPFEQLLSYIERTELLKLSGQFHQVIPELEHIWKTTTRMQADMTAQLAQAAARGNDQTTALLAIDKVSELEKMFQTDDVESSIATPLASKERGLVGKNSQRSDHEFPINPANLLANVKLAQQNSETQKAQQVAHQVYDLTLKLLDKKQPYIFQSSTLITPEFLYTFLDTLLELDLVIEAANIGKIAQQILPNDPDIVWLFAQALSQIGNVDDAIEHTDIALALAPDNIAIQRYLISLLIKSEHWHEARKESEALLDQAKTIHPEDYTTLAKCFLQTGQIKDAVLTCEKGLSNHPNAWQIHQLLGQIYQENKKYDSAKKHYSKAILEKPQMVEPWISLAGLYQETDEPQKALEKLQSAADVIPNNPEIYLNIGLLQMAAGRDIKALAAYSQAARFVSPETHSATKREIGLQLGKTLLDSGYIDEAITAYEKIHKENPTDETIAYGYGHALMQAQRYEEAFKAMSISIQASSPDSAVFLDYADLILILGKNPNRAVEFIQRVLAEEPENEKAKILLARATAAGDDHQNAIQLYLEAFQTNLALEPEYFTLLSTGIADSAFAIGQPEVAITYLQEALRELPDNLKLKQKLCQAFNQAIEILSEANQIAPQMAGVIIRLGYVLLENNQEQQARETFSQLFAAENVDIADMKMAAHALIGLGDISSSIPFIEKALEICDYQSNDLFSELTKLHLTEGNLPAALDTLNKHLELESTNSSLGQRKAQILLELGRQKASLDALKQAIQISPNNASLHAKAAIISRENQNLAAALDHIQRAMDVNPEDNQIRFLSAQIHHACLHSEKALEILSVAFDEPNTLQWLALKAEILVSLNPHSNLLPLAEISAAILEMDSTNATGLALQSILDAIEGKPKQADDLLESAVASSPKDGNIDLSNTVLIAHAALASGRWDVALHFASQAAQYAPEEPLGYLLLAKLYTLQAEQQLNCQATQTITHAPGKAALQAEAQTAFQEAIGQARQFIPETGNVDLIQKWEDRGQYALFSQTPSEEYRL